MVANWMVHYLESKPRVIQLSEIWRISEGGARSS